jgi:hypothetical protein
MAIIIRIIIAIIFITLIIRIFLINIDAQKTWVFCLSVFFAIMQHFSDCDGSAMFRISSNKHTKCNNSYQHQTLFDMFQTSSKFWFTWVGSHVLRVLYTHWEKRWGTHVLRVLSKNEFCALAPDFLIINFRLPCVSFVWQCLPLCLTIVSCVLSMFHVFSYIRRLLDNIGFSTSSATQHHQPCPQAK